MQKPAATSYMLLFMQGAIWGSSFQAIKFALEGFGPITVAAGRILLAALILTLYTKLRGHSFPKNTVTLTLLAVVGLFNCAIPFFLISWGEQSLDSGRTAIFMATGPLIALAIAHFTTKDERLNRYKAIGFVMGFVGVLLVIGLSTFQQSVDRLLPQAAIIFAATSYAVAGAVVKKVEGVSSSMVTATVLIAASLMTIPASLILESPIQTALSQHNSDALYAILYLGIVPTGLAFLVRFHLIKKEGYTFVAQVGYLVPMFGVLFGAVIFDEKITITAIAGLILILAGIVVSRFTSDSFKSRLNAN